MRVLPVVIDLEAARRHYKGMAEGKQRVLFNCSRLGKVIVGRGNSNNTAPCDQLPQVHLVTPTAMATEQARAKITRKRTRRASRKPPVRRRKPTRKQSGGRKRRQPIRRQKKRATKTKKKSKKILKGRVTKRKPQSRKKRQRDNFS